jgi:hypothetical protein
VPRALLLCCVLAALVAAGCGSSRAPLPDVTTPKPPGAPQQRSFPSSGVRFRAPQTWRVQSGSAPLVATLASGDAIVAVWRYPRTEILPKTKADVRKARPRLIAEARKRDASLKVVGSQVAKVDGAPAIVLVAQEVINGQVRLVRSTHVFAHGAEVVVDGYAPPSSFPAVNQSVFGPLVASLRLGKPA